MHHRTRRARAIFVWGILAAHLALLPATALAGPWVPAPGTGYLKLWGKWLPGFGYHTGDGDTVDYGSYNELFLATYGEVGIYDNLALMWHTDLVRVFVLEDPRSSSSETHVTVGDPAIGVRYQLLQTGRFVASVEGSLRVPLASNDPAQTVYSTEGEEIGALRVGTGVFDGTLGLSVGHGWDGWYLAGSSAYVIRSGSYHHAVSWSAEGGASFGRGWAARLRLSGFHSLSNGDAARHDSPSGMGNGTAYVGFALEGDHEVTDGWYVGLTFEGGIAGVRRQTGGPVISAYGAARF